MAETSAEKKESGKERSPTGDEQKPKSQAEEEKEGGEGEEGTTGPRAGVNFLSPEALLMIGLALIFDGIGLILFILSLFGIGIPFSWILDLIGLITIGFWMFFRTGHITTTKGAQKLIKKSGKKLLKRLGLATLIEIIPFVGDIAFCWTLAVYFEIKND